ncbi:MAG TPA: DUF4166 domain-containing protein [Alphaproteobacteria bacterium]|nr:DUF4166 domain-containing protein [Alphaproteobacteria bacterium]
MSEALFPRVIGPAFAALPAPVRACHGGGADRAWSGQATVEAGRHPLARLLHLLSGLPPAGADVKVTVRIEPRRGGEVWRRDFAGHPFVSVLRAGRGRDAGCLVERFGPATLAMVPTLRDGGIDLALRSFRLFGLPLPRRLRPRIEARAEAVGGQYRFAAEFAFCGIGPILRYRGSLEPVNTQR